MPSESRPRTAAQHCRDDGELMRKRVAVTRLLENGDQYRRHTSACKQDAAIASCGLQSERAEQIAQAHTG